MDKRGRLVEQNRFSVYFENEKVVRVEGGPTLSAAGTARKSWRISLRCVLAAAACKPEGLNPDEQTGYRIVLRACRSPLTWIAENAGKDGSLVCEKVADGKGSFGYNAATDKYEDLVESGVIDPTKVVRTGLQNAASVATLLLTSDALITDKPKDEGK